MIGKTKDMKAKMEAPTKESEVCKKSISRKINSSWKKCPAFWAIGLIFLTALVNRSVDFLFTSERDEVFIGLARRLTGQVDEETVQRVKEQSIAYLAEKLQSEYVTRKEFIDVNMTFSDLFKTNFLELSDSISSMAKLQDPESRYRELLCEVGNESKGGRMSVSSPLGWKMMRKMFAILKDDRTLRVPHVAEALLQMALRQGCIDNEDKRKELKEITLHAMSYLENSPHKIGNGWCVYKALTLLSYEPQKFDAFVLEQVMKNPKFERELKESRFLKDSFFTSDFWPLNK